MHRLFVALRPPVAIRRVLLALADGTPGVRWQDDAQLHLTLAFLGEVERPMAEDVAAALGRVDGPRPTLAINGVGVFERRGVAHTLWAGVAANGALTLLQQRVRRAVAGGGAAPEPRAFVPHVTLARLGRGSGSLAPFLARTAGLTLPPAEPDSFYLFESRLARAGASYEAIARYPLR